MTRGLSQRCACRLLSVARSALTYASRLEQRDAPVLEAMRELARQYPRYGYRRIQIFLARQGFEMSADRAYRLWRQAGLQVPRRRPRRRIAGGRPRPTPPTVANHVWAYDFVYDRCANGEQLKCLTVVDEWTRECLAIQGSGSILSRHVIDALTDLFILRESYCQIWCSGAESSGDLIDVCYLNSVFELHSSDHLGQVRGSA